MPLVAFKPTKARLVIEQGRESVLVIKRAGADAILTYFAPEIARGLG